MALRRLILLSFGLLLAAAVRLPRTVSAGDDWQPINPEELKMTSLIEAPGAPAVILFRQVDRDDKSYDEHNYVRIKILTEEGRKYGDIEIPMFKDDEQVNNVRARTIRPDGSIVPFDGKVYTRPIQKSKGVKYMAKTFTMPEVQVGSIIEYRYISSWKQYLIYDSHWILSEELFTRQAKFSLKPSTSYALKWTWPAGLPAGTNPPKEELGVIRLESQNIPAFQTEDYMPPENELKMRVAFTYTEDTVDTDIEKFWKHYGKKQNDKVEGFIGKKKAMEEAVGQIVASGDSPEEKLRKIYARVQQVRNTSYETHKTAEEAKREKEKEIGNVEELWKKQYGDGVQLTWLFLALARAAGVESYPVMVSARSEYFFKPNLMDSNQLNANVVLVKLNGKDIYCDPGAKFNPFGMLPWVETGVQGRRFDKDGGDWVTTTLPESADSQIKRKANFKVTDDGSLDGQLSVTYTGLEALSKRLEQRNEDEASRKKFLEDEVQGWIPAGIETELKNQPDWGNSAAPLVAEFSLKVPGWISSAGKRAILPVGIFSNPEKHVFEHINRVHPIYFTFPSEKTDDVTIELPAGWQVTSLPKGQKNDGRVIGYALGVENNKGTLHVTRDLNMQILLLDVKYYQALRNFFQLVRSSDDEQIVLQPGAAAAAN
jgi:hypothetical protein